METVTAHPPIACASTARPALRRQHSPTSSTMIHPRASSMAPIPNSTSRASQSALEPGHLPQWHPAEGKPGFYTRRQPPLVPLHRPAARRHPARQLPSRRRRRATPQLYPNPQVLCSGLGAATNSSTLASLGTCTIPPASWPLATGWKSASTSNTRAPPAVYLKSIGEPPRCSRATRRPSTSWPLGAPMPLSPRKARS